MRRDERIAEITKTNAKAVLVEIQMTKDITKKMDVAMSDLAQECGTNFRQIKSTADQKKADDLVFFNDIKESQELLKEQITQG